jgi:hypothetical protein
MYFFEIAIAEVALPQQIGSCDVIVWEGEKFIAEEDGVGVIVNVEVVEGEFV